MQEQPSDIAGRWLQQASADRESARHSLEGKRYYLVCFLAQQASKKALKAALYWYAGDRPRTHVIAELLAELQQHNAALATELADATALDAYYTATRYPDALAGAIPATTFHERDARLALDRLDTVLDKILSTLNLI